MFHVNILVLYQLCDIFVKVLSHNGLIFTIQQLIKSHSKLWWVYNIYSLKKSQSNLYLSPYGVVLESNGKSKLESCQNQTILDIT